MLVKNPQLKNELYPDLASSASSKTPFFCEAVQEVVDSLEPFRFDD